MPAPRDPRLLLSVVLEAASDPGTPPSLKERIETFLKEGDGVHATIAALDAAAEARGDERLSSLVVACEPSVQARRAEKMLIALASVLPPQISLRQALVFLMVARATLQAGPMTIAKIRKQAGLDDKGKSIIGTSITNTKASLVEAGLFHIPRQEGRTRPIRLSADGYALIRKAIEKMRGLTY